MRRNLPRRGQGSADRELLDKLLRRESLSSSSSTSSLSSSGSDSDSGSEWPEYTPPEKVTRLRKVTPRKKREESPTEPQEITGHFLRVVRRHETKVTEISEKAKETTSHSGILDRLCADIESSGDETPTPVEPVPRDFITYVSSTTTSEEPSSEQKREARPGKLAAFMTSSRPIVKQVEVALLAKAPMGRQGRRLVAALEKEQKTNAKVVASFGSDDEDVDSYGDVAKVVDKLTEANPLPRLGVHESIDSSFDDSPKAQHKNEVVPMLNTVLDLRQLDMEETNPNLVCFEQSQVEPKVVYLFSVGEVGGKLFLFCKSHMCNGKYETVCICVTRPCYSLSFLASRGAKEQDVVKEVEALLSACGGIVCEKVWNKRRTIDQTEEYFLTVSVTADVDLTRLPVRGKTFEAITGATQSLAGAFVVQKDIKGPQWITARCYKSPYSLTTVPLYTVASPSEITLDHNMDKPPFNVCALSVHVHNGKVFLLSMRVFSQWDVDAFDMSGEVSQSCQKVISLVVSNKGNGQGSESTLYFQNESELLTGFIEKMDKEDIDFIVGYDLKRVVPFLLRRMQANAIQDWHRIGRIPRTSAMSVFPRDTLGRFICDLKGYFENLFGEEMGGFSALVDKALGSARPQISDSRQFAAISGSASEFSSLIMYSRKDTLYMKTLLQKFRVLLTCQRVSRITGIGWTDVTWQDAGVIVESYLIRSLISKGFVVPDRKQVGENGRFVAPKPWIGFHQGDIAIFEVPFWFLRLLKSRNICVTTVSHGSVVTKPSGVFQSMVSELVNSYNKLDTHERESENDPTRTAIKLVVEFIPQFFAGTSKRFNCKVLADVVARELRAFEELFEEILYVDTDRIIAKVRNTEKCQEQLEAHYKGMKVSKVTSVEKVFVASATCFAAFGDEVFMCNCPTARWNWSPLTQHLCNRVFEICMKSYDPEIDVLGEIQKQAQDFKNTKPGDWAYKVPYSENLDIFAGMAKNMGCDSVELIRCKGGVLKKAEQVRDVSLVDTTHAIEHQIIPALLMVTKPFLDVSAAVLRAVLLDNDEPQTDADDLVFTCPHCQKSVKYNPDSPISCRRCKRDINWKFLSNSLCRSIRHLTEVCVTQRMRCNAWLCTYSTEQLPPILHTGPTSLYSTCSGTLTRDTTTHYQRLKGYETMFEFSECDPDDVSALKTSVRDFIHSLTQHHGFQQLKVSTLVTGSSSDTTCFSFV